MSNPFKTQLPVLCSNLGRQQRVNARCGIGGGLTCISEKADKPTMRMPSINLCRAPNPLKAKKLAYSVHVTDVKSITDTGRKVKP